MRPKNPKDIFSPLEIKDMFELYMQKAIQIVYNEACKSTTIYFGGLRAHIVPVDIFDDGHKRTEWDCSVVTKAAVRFKSQHEALSHALSYIIPFDDSAHIVDE